MSLLIFKYSTAAIFSFCVCVWQVFTWFGATIEMDGATETDYTADEVNH